MLEFDLHQGWSRGLRLVFENAERSLAFNAKLALHVDQVHGDHIHHLSEADLKAASPIAKADGIFVQGDFFKSSKRPLLIKTADCMPVFLIDRESQALAALHVGWRGLAQGIHTKLFRQGLMDPKTTWAWVGPSLGEENFEVREDMWSQFREAKDPQFFVPTPDPSVRKFNAWKFIETQLSALGVGLIYNVEEDTFSNTEYFSHRRSLKEGVERKGNNYSWCQFIHSP